MRIFKLKNFQQLEKQLIHLQYIALCSAKKKKVTEKEEEEKKTF